MAIKIRKRKFLVIFLPVLLISLFFHTTLLLAGRDLLYLLRPIWDTPPKLPENLIAHYYAASIPPRNLCSAHNWTIRFSPEPRVIDAFIFSIELDMLEIRLKELWSVVDTFILVEADKTFTGKDKPLVFTENRERFQWASEKLHHFVVRSLETHPTSQFQNEARLRGYMTGFINSVHPARGDLIISSDIDELPYPHTLQLLKSCEGIPPELHLEMNNYLYSFEFPLETTNWKPHVTVYDPKEYWYHHGRHKGNHLLADAGWHCSFCFRHVSEFVFKMTAYSHSDRVTRNRLLESGEIQRKICEGTDIFEMLPEEYTFKELISHLGKPRKSYSTLGIPEYIVENYNRFRYLMPGGCWREKE